MAENFSNLGKETAIQIQEITEIFKQDKPKRSTPRYMVIRMAKVKNKEILFKETRETQVINKVSPIRLSTNFAAATLWARGSGRTSSKVLK